MLRWLIFWTLCAGLVRAEEVHLPNPLLPHGADPSVVFHRGEFLLIQSEQAREFVLRRATNVAGLASAPKVSIAPPLCCNVWAPELVWLRGRWWIYYAKDDGTNANHRMYTMESVGDDPAGPYVERGKVGDATNDLWAIDGAPFEFDGKLFFVWSGWPVNHDGQQNLYLAPMSDPATISGPRVLLSQPDQPWERHGLPLQEGPEPLIRDGRLFIVYSASGSWTDDYCLGLLTFKGGDLLDPKQWVKSPQPVFAKANGTFGPGHNSMVHDATGSWWNVYHAIDESGGGWKKRSIRAQPFTWDAKGVPVFGKPRARD